jgi:hypothetical protein
MAGGNYTKRYTNKNGEVVSYTYKQTNVYKPKVYEEGEQKPKIGRPKTVKKEIIQKLKNKSKEELEEILKYLS